MSPSHPRLARILQPLPVLVLMLWLLAGVSVAQPPKPGPYVPSPDSVVAAMLRMAQVGPADRVIDLGSGDGRIVLTAAQLYGASGFGVEIRDELVALSNQTARQAGLEERVRFIKQDMFTTDISNATVVTMYLLPDLVNRLSDKLQQELRPGTRVLSHDYPIAGWLPDARETFEEPEKEKATGIPRATIYLYRIPAPVAGRWSLQVPAAVSQQPIALALDQQWQKVGGIAQIGGREMPFHDIQLSGEALTFDLRLDRARIARFSGHVDGDAIRGEVRVGDSVERWSARRTASGGSR
ncbi:MAG TPA: methyltransferase domain-containing protein [Burkholderiaceae bacterium]|nr:methyltransferase domain-containing protein [Burkholderiaceae bacterium]